MHRLRALPSAVQFERTRLHLGLALAFLVGSTLGPGPLPAPRRGHAGAAVRGAGCWPRWDVRRSALPATASSAGPRR